MSNPLLEYLKSMPPKARAAFAANAGTSPGALRLAAKGYRTGGRLAISPELAARLERASGGLLKRADLSPVCAACPHAPKTE